MPLASKDDEGKESLQTPDHPLPVVVKRRKDKIFSIIYLPFPVEVIIPSLSPWLQSTWHKLYTGTEWHERRQGGPCSSSALLRDP